MLISTTLEGLAGLIGEHGLVTVAVATLLYLIVLLVRSARYDLHLHARNTAMPRPRKRRIRLAGDKIKALRKQLWIKQDALASEAHVSRARVIDAEKSRELTIDVATKIVKALAIERLDDVRLEAAAIPDRTQSSSALAPRTPTSAVTKTKLVAPALPATEPARPRPRVHTRRSSGSRRLVREALTRVTALSSYIHQRERQFDRHSRTGWYDKELIDETEGLESEERTSLREWMAHTQPRDRDVYCTLAQLEHTLKSLDRSDAVEDDFFIPRRWAAQHALERLCAMPR